MKLTQEELASSAGLTSGAISQFETGAANFTVPSLVALASVLNCRPGDLLSYSPEEVEKRGPPDLRSALLAYGVDRDELEQVIRVIGTYVSDDEKSEQTSNEDQSRPANRRPAKVPSE